MFSNETIERVWHEATEVPGYDSNLFRKDCCGAWIIRNAYGNTDSMYGWEIDHVYPQALGGDDSPINLRAMQWENNRSKGDDYPYYTATIQSEDNRNIRSAKPLRVNEVLQNQLRVLYKL